MSATNTTTNYSLPLFIGTDKPAWLVDWNSAMSAIDAAIKGVDTDVQGAIVDISGLSSTVASHTSSISTISGQITVITTNLNTATGNINTINSLIGNGTPTTTDQTIIGAINELHADQGDLADLTIPAVSLVAAINAITGGGGAVAASAVSYSNATSGLVATNVQAAIDEVKSLVPTLIDITDQITPSGGTTIERAKVYGKLVEIDITVAANLAVSSTVFTITSAYAPPTPVSVPSTRLNSEGIVEVGDNGTATYYNDAVFASSQSCHIVYTID